MELQHFDCGLVSLGLEFLHRQHITDPGVSNKIDILQFAEYMSKTDLENNLRAKLKVNNADVNLTAGDIISATYMSEEALRNCERKSTTGK